MSPEQQVERVFKMGVTQGVAAIASLWEARKRESNEDVETVYKAMDTFFLGVMVKLTGGSTEDALTTINFMREQ